MEKYLVPANNNAATTTTSTASQSKSKPSKRRQWERSLIELNGKFAPKYRHDISGLLMQSYNKARVFPHTYHIQGDACPTHMCLFGDPSYNYDYPFPVIGRALSALEFDSKGIYLASVTKSGCLTVHDFDNLYCQGNQRGLVGPREDEAKQLLHISVSQQLDVVRWNLANQDEVACTSMKSSEVYIFDIGYISSEPVEILRKRPTLTVHGCSVPKGLSDIAFPSNDESRVLASDMHGVINVWDRRMSDLPCLEFTSDSNGPLNSIKLNAENQVIFGASKHGMIHIWDLRGGRSSAAFQNNREVYYAPLISLKLASELEKIGSLKAQSNIVSKEIHSIDIDPSCPNQLAFHLDDGWSGVLDIHNLRVTHVHCPPPSWLDEINSLANLSYFRKPCWLPLYSIYAVGSSSGSGLHLLDFFPDASSPCHVDYLDDLRGITTQKCQHKQNRFIPLSEGVTSCAAHPLNGIIVAGTKQSSLLVLSDTLTSSKDGDES